VASALLFSGAASASASASAAPAKPIVAQSASVQTQSGLKTFFTARVAPGQDASKVTWSWGNAHTQLNSASPAGVTLYWEVSVSGSESTLTVAALDSLQLRPRLGDGRDTAGQVVNYTVANVPSLAPRFRIQPGPGMAVPQVRLMRGRPSEFDGRTMGVVTAVYWQVYNNSSAPFGWVTIAGSSKELSIAEQARGSVLTYTPATGRLKTFRAVAVNFFGATICSFASVSTPAKAMST
jgi:hypothetical protein